MVTVSKVARLREEFNRVEKLSHYTDPTMWDIFGLIEMVVEALEDSFPETEISSSGGN